MLYKYYNYVTGFEKNVPNHTFSISRNAVLKYCNNCASLVLHYSHARLAIQVELSYSYYSVAISTVYYSQSGFEIVFYSPCNITDLVYRGGWVGGRGVGWGGGGGWQAGGGQKLPLGCIEWCCPLSR